MRRVDVYLVRVSVTEGTGVSAFLSATGRQMVRAVGTKLKNTGFPDDAATLFVAPSIAAAQTAELFAERIDFLGVPHVLPALDGGVPPQVAGAALLEASARGPVIVVADEPALSALGAWIVSRPTFPPLRPAQVSAVLGRKPAWYQRAESGERLPLLVA